MNKYQITLSVETTDLIDEEDVAGLIESAINKLTSFHNCEVESIDKNED